MFIRFNELKFFGLHEAEIKRVKISNNSIPPVSHFEQQKYLRYEYIVIKLYLNIAEYILGFSSYNTFISRIAPHAEI